MKTPSLILIPLLLTSSALLAQQGPGPGQGPRPPRGQPGQNVPPPPGQNDKGDKGNKPMPPPQGHVPQLLAALDADRDHTISKEEIRKAPAALRKLDRNKDGQLTVEEFGVPRPLPPKDGEGKGDRKGPPPPREGADGDAPDGPPPPRPPKAEGEDRKGPPPPRDDEDGEKLPPPPKGDRKGPPQGDKPGRPMGPPPPLVGALDADKDGKISGDEIKDSSDALRSLDKNKDGDLTPDEFAPKPPHPPKDGKGDVPPGPPPAEEAN